ncbi:hypothetical protein HDU91_003941 [Kappamyces sp. JEL0680]|nr:hypothetical protein HDU91_003941 [Kappamyces sp. JEL0680]
MGGVVDELLCRRNQSLAWSLTALPRSSHLFYSRPGMERRGKSVGRWPSFDGHSRILSRESKQTDAQFVSVSLPTQTINPNVIPSSVVDLKRYDDCSQCRSAAGPNGAGAILTLGDKEPFDLYRWLHGQFPAVPKLGLFASNTLFTTSHRHVLFLDDNMITAGGSVGAILKPRAASFTAVTDESCLYPLSDQPLTISRCQGNIVLHVDGVKASSLLVRQVADELASGRGKQSNHSLYAKLELDGRQAVVGVVGGDISKGTLALDTLMNLQPGTRLTFMRAREEAAQAILPGDGVVFSTLEKQETCLSSLPIPSSLPDGTVVDTGPVVAASEEGYVVSCPSTVVGEFQICNVPRMATYLAMTH